MFERHPRPRVADCFAEDIDDAETMAWAHSMGADFRRAWNECPRGEMLWAIGMFLIGMTPDRFERTEKWLHARGFVLNCGGSRDPERGPVYASEDWPRTNSQLIARLRATEDIDVLLADAGLSSSG